MKTAILWSVETRRTDSSDDSMLGSGTSGIDVYLTDGKIKLVVEVPGNDFTIRKRIAEKMALTCNVVLGQAR